MEWPDFSQGLAVDGFPERVVRLHVNLLARKEGNEFVFLTVGLKSLFGGSKEDRGLLQGAGGRGGAGLHGSDGGSAKTKDDLKIAVKNSGVQRVSESIGDLSSTGFPELGVIRVTYSYASHITHHVTV